MDEKLFILRDLKEWLERVPVELRDKRICLVGDGDEITYLNFSTQDVDPEINPIYVFEHHGTEYYREDGHWKHREKITTGYIEKTSEHYLSDCLEGTEVGKLLNIDVRLGKIDPSITEIVVLDDCYFKITVKDLLRKINSLPNSSLNLPLFYLGVDLKHSITRGIGFLVDPEKNKKALELGLLNKPNNIVIDEEESCELSQGDFVIEYLDNGELCDLSIWERNF